MAVDEGRAWALRTLGADGVLVREKIPEIIQDCHEKLANAQAAAEMNHSGPYGYIWRRCLDQFVAVLSRLPSAELVTVGRHKLVAFNGVVLFPWRYAKDRAAEASTRPFAVSDSRVSLFTQRHPDPQGRLPIEFDHPELSAEEHALLNEESKTLAETLEQHRVVVVPYASNPSALHSIEWGEATLGSDGYLTFESLESLLALGSGSLVDVGPTNDGFAEGPIPRPQLGVKQEDQTGETHA
ncbi:hypothetical protein [Promicromonospora sp. NPDC050880]|uniref:hypothetical protein n=1 Tax=Promicromonospora sp. NPDC050880 TaxID=3364406 RepID=UPI00379FF560